MIRVQFTRAQRILCLFAVFTTSLAVVALLFGHQDQSVQERVITTVLAAFLMIPCRVLLPIGFRFANTLPPLSAWPLPRLSSIGHTLLVQHRRLSLKVAQARMSQASRRHLLTVDPDARENRVSLAFARQRSDDSIEEIHGESQLDGVTGYDRAAFHPVQATRSARVGT